MLKRFRDLSVISRDKSLNNLTARTQSRRRIVSYLSISEFDCPSKVASL
jgi:hypothetical protein